MDENLFEKLRILSDAAKYDVSCVSSGVERKNNTVGGIGNASAAGICHAWSSDGRCISLLKILLTNDCIYDCKYCLNRVTNPVKRASFTPEEVAELTIQFYRRSSMFWNLKDWCFSRHFMIISS
jgi:predicted DNA-binding helix-hairpin-helix protein